MKKITFIKHPFTEAYLDLLPEDVSVSVIQSDQEVLLERSGVVTHAVRHWQKSIQRGLRFFGRETHLPMYAPAAGKILKNEQPNILVTADIYHGITRQCIRYAKRTPGTRLYVFSETKAWPQGALSRTILRLSLWWLKQNAHSVAGLFVYTDQGKEFFQHHAPELSVTVLPFPVSAELFPPVANKQYMPEGRLRVLMNARFVSYKRHCDAIKALAAAHDKGADVMLTCIGRAGSLKIQLQQLAEQEGVSQYISWLEPVPLSDILEIYDDHDVLLLPSQNEAIGLVVPEAMSRSLATITSDTVGANVYVEPGVTGLVFKTGDVGELCDCLCQFIQTDRVQSFGKAAGVNIHQRFTVSASKASFQVALGLTMTSGQPDAL